MYSYNCLILSVSRKVPLIERVARSFGELGIKGKVIGADIDPLCPGRFFVDLFWQMPKVEDLSFDELLTFCKKHNVRWIIPTRDGELLAFSKMKEKLQRQGIFCMVSDESALSCCLDKWQFSKTVAQAIPASFKNIPFSGDCFVVKERFGAGSQSLGLSLTKEEALSHAKLLKEPLFQPFIKGTEYSIDLYFERSGKCLGSIVRTRDKVVFGESQVTTSLLFPKLEALCIMAANVIKPTYHVVFQAILEETSGSLYLLEANLRFGGASTLSLEMGMHSFIWFFLETLGKPLTKWPFIRSTKEKRQVRYPKDLVFDV